MGCNDARTPSVDDDRQRFASLREGALFLLKEQSYNFLKKGNGYTGERGS